MLTELELAKMIRDVPDFPKKGILFKDITTLVKDRAAFKQVVDMLTERFRNKGVELVVGVEARGFIFCAPLAYNLGVGFVPVRKPGKLPAETIMAQYSLEYGTDTLEMHKDAIKPGQKVLIVDDLLATGGTIGAVIDLVKQLRGEIVGLGFVVELTFLQGRKGLEGYDMMSMIRF